jgi:hypothetical protein
MLFPLAVTGGPQWDVSRDGQRFLVESPLDAGREIPITVVMNWESSLKH